MAFKIGDLVKVVHSTEHELRVWRLGIIKQIFASSNLALVTSNYKPDVTLWLSLSQLRFATQRDIDDAAMETLARLGDG